LTRYLLFGSIVLEGYTSNRISIRGARRGDQLLNLVIPRLKEVGSLRSLIFSFWKRLFIYSKWNARTCSPSVLFCFAKEMNAFFDTCLIDTGIASEKEWGINLLDEAVKESGTNEDGSTWYRESGEDRGENGYWCRWTRMGGKSHDGSTEWTETVCSWLFTYSGIPYYLTPCSVAFTMCLLLRTIDVGFCVLCSALYPLRDQL
jgi:hypothetical protein